MKEEGGGGRRKERRSVPTLACVGGPRKGRRPGDEQGKAHDADVEHGEAPSDRFTAGPTPHAVVPCLFQEFPLVKGR
jgi:hypothetical protein